jgi:chromosome segregation ATPase
MKNSLPKREARLLPSATTSATSSAAKIRAIVATLLLLVLASCVSQAAKDAEIAAVEAERVAVEQAALQVVANQARAREAELQAQRDQVAAERARVEEVRQRQLVEAKARADAEREEQEAIAQAERDRRAVIAAAQAQRQDRLDRITALQQQIASIETEVGEEGSKVATLTRAIQTAEELLTTLAAEQAKYEDTDEQGNTVEPLAKELIAELESRKNELVRQANSL